MKVRQFYPVTLSIDGEDVALRVKRMTMEEHSDFSRRLAKVGTPTYVRFVSRGTSGPEQERDDKGEYAIPFQKLAEQKLPGLSPEKRVELEEATEADEAEAKKFLTYVFTEFVTVEKGLVEELPDGSERSVVDGLDVLRIFGARRDVLQQVLEAVRQENELDVSQKKILSSPTGSSRSSSEPDPGQAGPKPETTVSPVEIAGSAGNGDATSQQEDPSGSTDGSQSTTAPSLP